MTSYHSRAKSVNISTGDRLSILEYENNRLRERCEGVFSEIGRPEKAAVSKLRVLNVECCT